MRIALATLLIVTLTAIFALGACRGNPSTATPPPKTAALAIPATFTVKQRTSAEIPGSNSKLRVALDDITHGQVQTTILDADQKPLAGPESMTTGKSLAFSFAEHRYSLTLTDLRNALVGEDIATFLLADAPTGLTETDKINRLLAAVEQLRGAVFIRNGTEYSAADAADHMRRKQSAQASQIHTADEFIELCCTKSSTSGQPYRIRFADGREVTSEAYLREVLRDMVAKP